MNNLYFLRHSVFHNQLCLALGSGSQKHAIDSNRWAFWSVYLRWLTHHLASQIVAHSSGLNPSTLFFRESFFTSPKAGSSGSTTPDAWVCHRSPPRARDGLLSCHLPPLYPEFLMGRNMCPLHLDVFNNVHVENSIRNTCWSNVWLNKHIKEARREKGKEGLRK